MEAPAFGPLLRRARLAAGYATQRAFAGRMGVARVAIVRLESGGRSDPRWSTVYRAIVGGDLRLHYFFPPELVLASARAIRRAS